MFLHVFVICLCPACFGRTSICEDDRAQVWQLERSRYLGIWGPRHIEKYLARIYYLVSIWETLQYFSFYLFKIVVLSWFRFSFLHFAAFWSVTKAVNDTNIQWWKMLGFLTRRSACESQMSFCCIAKLKWWLTLKCSGFWTCSQALSGLWHLKGVEVLVKAHSEDD